MNLNPPLPFDRSSSQTDYSGWFDMINSIVGFVTASTHLATTLRNSRCCFPENISITEVTEGCSSSNGLNYYSLSEFPWFMEELNKTDAVSRIEDNISRQFRVREVTPLVQYPLYDVMHGEPNHEPRTFTLIDTRDFGDVDFKPAPRCSPTISPKMGPFNSVPSMETTRTVLRYNPEQISSDSCYFQEYTDSDQTIDSANLQEYFEKVEEHRQMTNSSAADKKVDGLPLKNSHSSYEKRREENIWEVSEEIEQSCTIYPVTDHRVEGAERPEVTEQAEPTKCTKLSNRTDCSEQIRTERSKKPKRIRRRDVYFGCTAKGTETDSNKEERDDENITQKRKAISTRVHLKPRKVYEDNSSATEEDCFVFKCAESTQVESLGQSQPVIVVDGNVDAHSMVSVYRRKRSKSEENKARSAATTTIGLGTLKKKKDSKMNNMDLKATCAAISRKLEYIQTNILAAKSASMRLSKDSVEKKPSKNKNKSKNEKVQSRKDLQYLAKMDCIKEKEPGTDFITKNIVNCLNLRKKARIAEQKELAKNRLTSVFVSPKEQFPSVLNPQQKKSNTSERKTRKASDRKSSSADEVKPHEASKLPGPRRSQSKDSAKKPISKTVSNKDKPSVSEREMTCVIPRPILKLPDAIYEMRSCLRKGTLKSTGSPKSCIFQEEIDTGMRRPVTCSVTLRTNNLDRILPRIPLIRDTTLKLTAAQTVKKASELLKDVEERLLRPATEMQKRVVSSGTNRPVTVCVNKKV